MGDTTDATTDAAAPDGDGCTLCGLPTPDPPVTDPDAEGAFCCQGCLTVANTLDDAAAADPASVRAELRPREDDDTDEGGGKDPSTAPDPPADAAETFLAVDGMHCATCEAFLEGRAADRDGVHDAAASYASGLLKVVHDPELVAEDIADDVAGAGYRVRPPGEDREEGSEVGRLLVGGFFGMMTMAWYLLFLYPTYLGLPPKYRLLDLAGSEGAYLLANVWVMTTVVLLYTGRPLLQGALVSLRTRRPNMDLLVALAATTAYVYSIAAGLAGHREVYFDISVVVVLAVSFGGYYERRLRERAAGELAGVVEERVDEARRIVGDALPDGPLPGDDAGRDDAPTADDGTGLPADASTETVSVDDLAAGDAVVVRRGERIPADGRVQTGTAAVDESLLTGESVPQRREPGEEVIGGSIVRDGGVVVAVGEDGTSTLDRLRRLQWDVRSTRSGVQRLADRLAGAFVPAVVAVAVAAALVHLLALGTGPTAALLTGLTVLVVSCPCALGLATPLAVAAGMRDALREGVVVADGEVFERAAEVDLVAFDKTGTLTTGEMRLLDVSAADEPTAVERAAAVEAFADHPVAAAIRDAARADGAGVREPDGDLPRPDGGTAPIERGTVGDDAGTEGSRASGDESAGGPRDGAPRDAGLPAANDVEHHAGRGVSGVVDGERVVVGRRELFEDRAWAVPDRYGARADRAREEGALPTFVGWDGAVRGVLVAGDDPREGWEDAVSELAADRRVVVISGDDPAAVERFESHPGVDEVFADVRPEAKVALVERLRRDHTVAMVGDGSNDAPALAAADLGVALRSGTALAADAADVIAVSGDLASIPRAFEITAASRRRIRENLGWAFVYNAVAVPAAVLGLLSPVVAAVAMAASSLLVVGNSSRSVVSAPDDD